MNDRLQELQQHSASTEGDAEGLVGAGPGGGGGGGGDVEAGMGGRGGAGGGGGDAGASFMEDFFRDVDDVKAAILQIREGTNEVGSINQAAVLATTGEREHDLSLQLNACIQRTQGIAKSAKDTLARMRSETEELKRGGRAKASELRIRENLCNTLTRKYVDIVTDYQNAQQKYKTDIKKKVNRQVRIVKPEATQEEIDQVLRSGGTGDVYKSAILKGAADAIENAYRNVADKYQDVLALEASVKELHQMFLDFALLTEQQGELLDQIEYQVKSASDYIEDGNADVAKAIEYQKAIRKKQCICIGIVLVVLVVVLAAAGVFNK